MDISAQVIAATLAGLISPFVQEIIFGRKISGRLAGFISIVVALVIATIAYWVTGGFATAAAGPAFNFLDPSAFFAFWWKLWSPVYAISQTLFSLTTHHDGTGPVQTVSEKVVGIASPGNP